MHHNPKLILFISALFLHLMLVPALAHAEFDRAAIRQAIIEKRLANRDSADAKSATRFSALEEKPSQRPEEIDERYDGRSFKLYLPKKLEPIGERAMVVVLHGGGANASFMQATLDMNAVAERHGFVVAYLNGTRAAPMLPSKMRSWNAGGGCCGKAYEDQVDDVGYITGAVGYLAKKYGVDAQRVYALGHSNGAIMAQRMVCTTDVFQAAVPISGTLASDISACPKASGKRLLAIHGQNDENVPIIGGVGTKGPNKAKQVNYRAEASAKELFERAGASYTIDIVKDTDHSLQHLDTAIRARDGYGISEKAVRFFWVD